MLFKNKEVQSYFPKLDSMLQKILFEMDEISKLLFKKEIFVTSTWRKKTNDSGIHALYRAADCRTENYYTTLQLDILVSIINATYSYDDKRPEFKVTLYHEVEGSTWHIHIQVHPNTKRLW